MTLPADYVHQRYADPDMKVRDIGRSIADTLWHCYGPSVRAALALDSEAVTETLGERFLAEMAAAGYSVTFTGRRMGHV